MPLRNHFRSPFSLDYPWESFHSMWAGVMVEQLNRGLLPPDYYAIPHVKLGPEVEIDVVEVRVFERVGGPQLRAAIELVSPANKDRPTHRRAFAVKCASYLQQQVSVVVIDVVTNRNADLHGELVSYLEPRGMTPWSSPTGLDAIAYRTRRTKRHLTLDVWPEPLAVGRSLPTMPLWLASDLAVPLDLEASYAATCRSLRLPPALPDELNGAGASGAPPGPSN